MKRFIYYTLLCCVALAMGACSHTDELESINMGDGMIKISTSPSSMELVRSADNSLERKVTHIDVFVVKSEGADAGQIVHYERNTSGNNASAEDGAGTISLRVKRSDAKFIADAKYTIYMVANASLSESDAAAKATLEELESWIQSDVMLHVTGTQLGSGDRPEAFLMQAIAGNTSGQVINSSAGNSENLSLSATLERAASKIVVTIKQGEHVEFHRQLSEGENVGNALYYFNMLPTKSYVLPKNTVSFQTKDLVTTVDLGPNERTFVWTQAAGHTAEQPKHEIRLVGYAYAHNWSAATALDETCAIVNIPMKWDKDGNAANGKETSVFNSWYMIPLSKDKKFGRNKCYAVTVTIDTAGADDRTSVVELDDVYFETLPWQEVEISVGETGNDPKYLTLNTNLVQIYNADVDSSQLTFSSSSPIRSITLRDIDTSHGEFSSNFDDNNAAYYKNKYNQIKTLSSSLLSRISASAEANVLNGKITIRTPNEDHNNTIRYLEFEVENEDGLKADFRVEQYPVIYITNEVGWYSYRDDFIGSGQTRPTTYVERNGSVVSVALNNYNSSTDKLTLNYYTNYSGGGGGFWGGGGSSINGFWGSKVNGSVNGPGSYDDALQTYDVKYYRWTSGDTTKPTSYISASSTLRNARMYHVRVTATSPDYTIGRPKFVMEDGTDTDDVENGYTEGSDSNARLVSPSFMIASQLGYFEVMTFAGYNNNAKFALAKDHCKNYVEVSADGKEYDNWRLPTEAEIRIILQLQGSGTANSDAKAIDEVMNADAYFAANGVVNRVSNPGNTAVRCVRDAY
ncbi:MAG: hypothetical protein IIX79_05620 [Alistipes sp.]|nr:hypothetical protein [Alistipes sp.]